MQEEAKKILKIKDIFLLPLSCIQVMVNKYDFSMYYN